MTTIAKDTPMIKAELEKARGLAGDDKYLLQTECLQCREIGPDGEPTGPGGGAENVNAVPTKLFDNLYYVGGTRTGSFVFTTSDGYIMVDSMYGNSPEETLIPNMQKLGLDPAKIKYILITHPGPDHLGGAKYFQEKYGSRIVMTEQDWNNALNPPPKSWMVRLEKLRKAGKELPNQEKNWKGPPKRDLVGTDGQKLTLGDTTATMVFTPRTAGGGGFSYIIPVTDNGVPHMWATFGNTGIPGTIEDKKLYRESVKHFISFTDAAKVDVIISNHPFVDGSMDRMEELRNRKPGEANPFVIGQDGARRYIDILDQCAVVCMARNQAGLDDTGIHEYGWRPKRP